MLFLMASAMLFHTTLKVTETKTLFPLPTRALRAFILPASDEWAILTLVEKRRGGGRRGGSKSAVKNGKGRREGIERPEKEEEDETKNGTFSYPTVEEERREGGKRTEDSWGRKERFVCARGRERPGFFCNHHYAGKGRE